MREENDANTSCDQRRRARVECRRLGANRDGVLERSRRGCSGQVDDGLGRKQSRHHRAALFQGRSVVGHAFVHRSIRSCRAEGVLRGGLPNAAETHRQIRRAVYPRIWRYRGQYGLLHTILHEGRRNQINPRPLQFHIREGGATIVKSLTITHPRCLRRRGDRMKRREFISLLGGAAAWPLAAHAQQPAKTARIGYLAFRSPIPADDAFLKGLAELGWIEGQNIVIERRFAGGNVEQLKGSAAELVRLNVDVIVAAASAPTKVAKEATASIPIVFANAGDPVGQGFVQSLPRPGGNITGIAFDASPDINAKQAQLLIEI